MAKKKKKSGTQMKKPGQSLENDLYNFLADKSNRGSSLKNIFKWAAKTDEMDGIFDVYLFSTYST